MPNTINELQLANHFGVSRSRIRNLRPTIDPLLRLDDPKGRPPGQAIPIVYNRDMIYDRLRRLAELYALTPTRQRAGLPSPFVMLQPEENWAAEFRPPMTAEELAAIPAPRQVESGVPELPASAQEVYI